jgi:antitoxin (DNA-binding transcriptional repressor) of toxin-antitoxin stability system
MEVDIDEAKADLSRLLERLALGEEVTIAEAGETGGEAGATRRTTESTPRLGQG